MQESWHYSNRASERQHLVQEIILGSSIQDTKAKLPRSELLVSPTVFRKRGFRFAFFSNEEPRMHVHVTHEKHEAKFWLEPTIELAHNNGLTSVQIKRARRLIEEHEDEIKAEWQEHFGS